MKQTKRYAANGHPEISLRASSESGLSVCEYLILMLILASAIVLTLPFLGINPLFGRAQEQLASLGGGSSTSNGGTAAITDYDCAASAAIGVWLEGLCPCGGPGDAPCPAFHVELEMGLSSGPRTKIGHVTTHEVRRAPLP